MTWLLAMAVASLLVWVVAWWVIRPRLQHLGEPREPRLERRRRLADLYSEYAIEVLDAGYPRDALIWARRAIHLAPGAPRVQASLGEVQFSRHRPKAALKWLHRAYITVLTQGDQETYQLAAGEAAYGISRCHAILATDARDRIQREQHDDECLRWLQVALDHDSRYCENAEHEAAFARIRPQVGRVVAGATMGGDWLAC